jgi:hypothetical protein
LPLNLQSLPSGILAWKGETDKGGFIRLWRIPQGRNPKSAIVKFYIAVFAPKKAAIGAK